MSRMDQVTQAPKPGKGQRIAVTTTGTRTALESTIAGMGWVRVFAKTADVQLTFGLVSDTIPVLDSTTQSEVGYSVAAGTYHDFWLSGKETHVLWDASAAGFLELHKLGEGRVKTEL